MGLVFGPVFGASECWHISRGLRKQSHFGACILVLANTFELIFGIAQSDTERPFLQQYAAGGLKVQLRFKQLKLAAFLPSAALTVQLRKYLFLPHLFDCKPQNIVAVVVHESATAQEAAVEWQLSKKKR